MTPVFYLTDIAVFILLVLGVIVYRQSDIFKRVLTTKRSIVAVMILSTMASIGILDCIHYRYVDEIDVHSLLDAILAPLDSVKEVTYSAPFSAHRFNNSNMLLT